MERDFDNGIAVAKIVVKFLIVPGTQILKAGGEQHGLLLLGVVKSVPGRVGGRPKRRASMWWCCNVTQTRFFFPFLSASTLAKLLFADGWLLVVY